MSLKLWSTGINKLYLWSTEIKQAYLWSTEIFSTDTWNWLLTNLVSYYKADSSTTFPDAHWSNDWTISGASYTSSWKINWAYSFDWDNDHVVNSDFSIWSTTDFSMSFWFSPNAIPDNTNERAIWLWTWNWSDEVSWEFSRSNASSSFKQAFFVKNTSWTYYAVKFNQTFSIWTFYYITYTFDQSTMKIYVNWVLDNSMSVTWNFWQNTTLTIWDNNWLNWVNWPWIIDELWIWTKILSTDDLSNLYNSWDWLSYDSFTT